MPESRDVESWSRELANALGIDSDVDVAAVLDLARIAAHAIARPAAPVTTFIAGYALARGIPLADVIAEVERRTSEEAP
jgi:hypothetical protein